MTAQTSTELGVLLRRHRLAAGLTQEELAEAAGVSARSIGDLERGLQRTPYPGTIRRLADALDLNAEERKSFLDAAAPSAPRPVASIAEEMASSQLRPRPRFLLRRFQLAAALAVTVALAILAFVFVRANSSNRGTQLGAFVQSLAVSRTVGLGRPAAIAVARDGTTYVLDQSSATVHVFGSGGDSVTTWGRVGSGAGQMRSPDGLAIDSRNHVYVADTGNDRIEKFTGSGRLLAVWGSQPAGLVGMRSPVGIAVDSGGIVYVADTGELHVMRLDPSGHRLDDLTPATAIYSAPKIAAVAVGPSGDIYVADARNDLVYIYGVDGVPASNQLTLSAPPSAIAADSSGDIYVAYRSLAEIQEFSPQGDQLATWRGNGLSTPSGIALETAGHLLAADPGSRAVMKLTGRGWIPWIQYRLHTGTVNVAGRIAVGPRGSIALADMSTGRVSWLSRGLRAPGDVVLNSSKPARFVGPIGGLATAPDGTLYVSDYGAGDVLKITADGQIAGIWGTRPSDPGMSHPRGVAVDRAGDVYVVDEDGGRIVQFSPQGRSLAVFPLPQPASGSLVGPSPNGVAVDNSRNLYVTDEINDHLIKLDASGRVLFVWGHRGSGRTGLRVPQGVAVDERRGRVYAIDDGNNRMQVLSTTGKWLGSTPANRPEDVAVDPSNGLAYVLDAGGTRVQIFAP